MNSKQNESSNSSDSSPSLKKRKYSKISKISSDEEEQEQSISSKNQKTESIIIKNEVPESAEDLKKLNHEQILKIVVEELQIPSAIDTIEKGLDTSKNRYPPNALNGYHLYNAIEAYHKNIRSGGTEKTATQDMVEDLMGNKKVLDEDVAKSISNWLYHSYIAKEEAKLSVQGPKTLEIFFEKILQGTLNSINRRVEEIIAQSSTRLISSFGYNFEFVGRENSIKKIRDCHKEYLEKVSDNGQVDKQSFLIPFIAAAPGVGKTKLLKHYAQLKVEEGFYPIFISFGNGTSYGGIEKKIEIESSLSLRMVFSLYCGLVDIDKQLLFATFIQEWINYFHSDVIDIASTLKFFKNLFVKLFKKDFKQFYFAIDEIHHIDDGKNATTNRLRQVLSEIGRYMQKPQFKLLPLFAGTYYTVIRENFIGSTYKSEFIPVKAFLSHDEQVKLLNALSIKKNDKGEVMYQKLKNWRTNRDFRHFLRVFGGYPRGIEQFLKFYLEKEFRYAYTSFTLASEQFASPFSTFIDPYLATIFSKIILQEPVEKSSLVIKNGGDSTWSILENHGVVLLEPISASAAIVYNPPVFLEKLLEKLQIIDTNPRNFQLLLAFRKFFLQNSDIYWQTWENIVHVHVYLIFSLLSENQNVSMKQLFPFALMNSNTSEIIISKIHRETLLLESLEKLNSNVSSNQNLKRVIFEQQSTNQICEQVYLLNQKSILVVKNVAGASAGDILVFGLENNKNEKLVFHYQCKWSDVQDGDVKYSKIESEIQKNQKLTVDKTNVKNITVIISGTMISGLPSELPDNLIIVYKENFNKYFGVLSDAMKSCCAQQFIRINELDERGLQSFVGVGEATAKRIIENRGDEGFLNLEDLKSKLESNYYNYLLYGTNTKEQMKNANQRTILF